jgi:homoserine dehydrogenase
VRGLGPEAIAREAAAGRRVRLDAALEPDGAGGWRASVGPRSVPADHPLAVLGAGGRNALVYRGDAVGEVWIAGQGAGADATASGVLADVLDAVAGRPGPTPIAARVPSVAEPS